MKGVTISDSKYGLLTFDLIDVLNVIGDKVVQSNWTVTGVEAVGVAADDFHKISDRSTKIPGTRLLSISSNLVQTIDGVFGAYLGSQRDPWVVIRAVDSSEFDVETDDGAILDKIRARFESVSDLPRGDL